LSSTSISSKFWNQPKKLVNSPALDTIEQVIIEHRNEKEYNPTNTTIDKSLQCGA
jgi:hypothetical protein